MQIKQLYHLLRLSAFCLVMAMVANCADSVDFEQPQLDVSEQALTFNTQGEEKTIMVNTNCKEWIATSPKQWIHLTPNGNELIVKVDANVTEWNETAISLSTAAWQWKITVSQSADNQSLGISGGEVVLPQVGGTTSVNVNTGDIPYELIQAESTDWLQIVKKKHSLKFISKPNYDTKERTVKLKISIGGKNTDVVVKQPGVCAFVLACNPAYLSAFIKWWILSINAAASLPNMVLQILHLIYTKKHTCLELPPLYLKKSSMCMTRRLSCQHVFLHAHW